MAVSSNGKSLDRWFDILSWYMVGAAESHHQSLIVYQNARWNMRYKGGGVVRASAPNGALDLRSIRAQDRRS
jgi:hypothetical protein